MQDEKIIGIVAGVGPFAGLDLLGKILAQTIATKDQDHLTIASISRPQRIVDRTEYLLGQTDVNPAYAIARQLIQLEQMGAVVAGIPCNTAHAPAIFDVITAALQAANSQLKLLHMLAEVTSFLREYHSSIQCVGVLSTTGAYQTRIYPYTLELAGFAVVVPDEALQRQKIHPAVYDPVYGIKACGCVTALARENLLTGVYQLQKAGAEAVILGCTEMPLAISERSLGGVVIVDPTLILARSLIREANAAKLKPFV